MVTKLDVVNAYRLFLGREPESEAIVEEFLQVSDLDALRRMFIESQEFKSTWNGEGSSHRLQDNAPISVDTVVAEDVLASMIAKIERDWNQLGQDEPFWSVLSSEEFKRSQFSENADTFYQSGKGTVEWLDGIMARLQLNYHDYSTCLEYGCGVGRITRWLCDRFSTVMGCDISAQHLALADRCLQEAGVGDRIQLRLVRSLLELNTLPNYDFFFSVIVLQHNPPPVIGMILNAVLDKLRSGGVAVFQVPTYAQGYHFDAATYVTQPEQPAGQIEMHVYPQPQLFQLFNAAQCDLLECREDNWVGNEFWISNTLVVRKR